MILVFQFNAFKAYKAVPVVWAVGACFLAATCQPVWADAAKPAGGHIVKWVDENGVTHYSDGIPAQYSGRDNAEINPQGIVIRRNKTTQPTAENREEEALNQKALEQRRRDRSLLASYTTAQEIDLARERNLQLDEIALQGLKQRRETAINRLSVNRKSFDSYTKSNKPAPADLAQSLSNSQAQVARIDQEIARRVASMEATRARFNRDKQRFLQLKPATSINDSNLQESSLATLNARRAAAQERFDYFQKQVVANKRSGESSSEDLLKKLQNAQNEINRVDQLIAQGHADVGSSAKGLSDSNVAPVKPNPPNSRH